MPVCQTGHQPGLAAHFHGRKGSFSSPVCQSFPALPPVLPHLTGASPVQPDCSPADLIQTLQTSSSPRSQNTSGSTAACSHVGPQSARAGSARRSGTCQLSTRSREPSALDARPHCCRCVLGPCCNRLRRQPLLVPGRAGTWEHDDDHWKQGRWGSGGHGWQILFNGIWF
ncbi:PDZK1 interacting protein 1, isoform CRA_c [Rattus norvegicus]|uniref:PDZK1 interacting protein 1, isoform CRA_c n=1 Tax=Rattus norvegicus TaxID=10116 RepID=A6JZ31_RAT|nr:PDZK1 interacting protein 1, isoform CRA_c [Rattus norvegicus]